MFRKSNSRERPQNVCDRVADLLSLIHTKFSPLSLDILKNSVLYLMIAVIVLS